MAWNDRSINFNINFCELKKKTRTLQSRVATRVKSVFNQTMYFSGALCLWPWLCLVTQAIGRARIPTRSQPELGSQQPELDWHQPELDSQPNESKSFRLEPSHQSRSALQPQSWPNYRPQIRLGATEGKIFWKFGAHFDKKVQRYLKFGSLRQNFASGVQSAL